MKRILFIGLCISATARLPGVDADEFLDRLGEALRFGTADSRLRARVTGTFDLETYRIEQPTSLLLFSEHDWLLNPRLTLSLDGALGSRAYVFAQARLDRGFDPANDNARLRLDEYALRLAPWPETRVQFQIGKFATVVGNWVKRHRSWENPFVTAPLPYENLTAIWDFEAARSTNTLLRWAHIPPGITRTPENADKALRLPIIWGPSYASGAAVFAQVGKVELDAEVKNTSLSARPQSWDISEVQWQHPTFSGHVSFRPNATWDIGFSASTGSYLLPRAQSTIAAGHDRGDYREIVLAHDIGFAWRHVQVWAEFMATRFEIPAVGDARTFAYYVEAKYKFTPQIFGALRWNQQFFGNVSSGAGQNSPWGRDTWRIDVAPTYRLAAHVQLKLQYSLLHEDLSSRTWSHLLASQLTVRF